MPFHFGVLVKPGKRGLKLTREQYALINKRNSFYMKITQRPIYANPEGSQYTDEWCQKHREECLQNFDLNMEYFSLLDKNEFNQAIDSFLKINNHFFEIDDLNQYDGAPGYYVLVLDEYCQIYVGTTKDIKARVRAHWGKNKQFDRLLLPMGAVDTSVMSIDSFRALDTTRIFVYPTNRIYCTEDNLINSFPPKFVCNRIGGGKLTGGLLQAIATMKKRSLIK